MNRLVNKDNFSAIKASNSIAQICNPLSLLGITFFNHIRIYQDLSRLSFSNRGDWLEHFFAQQYYNHGRFSKNPFLHTSSNITWKTMGNDGVVQDAKENFNIDNGFTIIKSH